LFNLPLSAAALCLAAVVATSCASPSEAARQPAASGSVGSSARPAAAPAVSPNDAAALGGHNVLIADRGNNRLLLVSPEKRILWEYAFPGLRPGSGADDAFFTPDGKRIIVNLEHEQVIEIIDRASKTVTWQYGTLGKRGSAPGLLDYPDDAYLLPNGDVIVADIRNCRILEIAPDKRIVRQAGVTGRCAGAPPALASPNGDKPLPNGHVLVSTIGDHSLIELDQDWQQIMKLAVPIRYPSDPQMTAAGNFLVAAYTRPGKIIEIGRDGNVVWDYTAAGDGLLNRPSLAIELPNGNVLANDDLNHRVIVIDKASKKILWQYGVTGVPGSAPGYLSIPDGLDIETPTLAQDFTSKRRME
jgi:hypothetical protein